MPNLGLTQLAATSSTKRTTIDANSDVVDNAQTELFTADMTSGNVTLTDSEFRNAIEILGDNVSTGGRTCTIPNLAGIFLIRGDSGNTESFDLVKGATSVAIAPGEISWYISGAGANDLERGGVLGLGAGTVTVPRQRLKVGFNGPGSNVDQGFWNGSTGEITGAVAPMQQTFVDDAGLDLTLSSNGLLQIPAGSGISKIKYSSTAVAVSPNQESAGFGMRQFRGQNGGTSETALVFRERSTITGSTWQVPDRPVTFDGVGAPFQVQEETRQQFQYQAQGGDPLNIYPQQSQGVGFHEVEVVDAAPAGTKPEPVVSNFYLGTPSANEVISSQMITRPILLQDALAGSDAFCGTNPSSATVFDIHANGEKFGEVSFSSAGVPTFSYIADGACSGTNLGFESGSLTGWSTLHGSGGAASSSNPRTGTWHYRVTGLSVMGISQGGLTLPSGWNNLVDARLVTTKMAFYHWANSTGKPFTAGVQHRSLLDTNARALERIKWIDSPTYALDSTYNEQVFELPTPPGTREIDILIECISQGNGTGDLDDVTVDLTLKDVILYPGVLIEIVAPASLNGIADISITLQGRLV